MNVMQCLAMCSINESGRLLRRQIADITVKGSTHLAKRLSRRTWPAYGVRIAALSISRPDSSAFKTLRMMNQLETCRSQLSMV